MDPPGVIDADDILAQPARPRLFALLSERRRPADTAEPATRLDLPHTSHAGGCCIELIAAGPEAE